MCVCVVWCVVLCCAVLCCAVFVCAGRGWVGGVCVCGGGGGGGSLPLSNDSVAGECVSSYIVACNVYYNIIPHHVLDRIISSVYNPQMQTILQKKKHFAIPSKPCVSDWYRQLMLATNRERIQP